MSLPDGRYIASDGGSVCEVTIVTAGDGSKYRLCKWYEDATTLELTAYVNEDEVFCVLGGPGDASIYLHGNKQVATVDDLQTPRFELTAENTTPTLQPGKYYVLPVMASLAYKLAPGKDGVVNEYRFRFVSGATATVLTHPAGVNSGGLAVEPNRVYEISIIDGLLAWQDWEVTA